jgi:site-specific DNA-methyltransferase (adenine-specific)
MSEEKNAVAPKFHEYCLQIPVMGDEELAALADDIGQNGLYEPIILYRGQILDGRHRFLACQKSGVVPKFEEYTGDDPLGFVLSKNATRRQATDSQSALAAARLANYPAHRPSRREKYESLRSYSQAEVALKFAVSVRLVQDAAKLLRLAEAGTVENAVIDAVNCGKISIRSAFELSLLEPGEQRMIVSKGKEEIILALRERSRAAVRASRLRGTGENIGAFENVEKIGDSITLFNGDMFEILPKLNIVFDMVCADLPYATETFGDCIELEWDRPIPLDQFWELVVSKTTPAANVCLFANMKLAVDLINSNPAGFRYDMIWSKNTKSGFLNANMMPLRSHEFVLVFASRPERGYAKQSVYNPQKTPAVPGRAGRRELSRRAGSIYGNVGGCVHFSDGTAHPASVLAFDSEVVRDRHPTAKPTSLLVYLLNTFSDVNDLVLDPCMGGGSAGVAAIQTGRQFVGIEKDEKYFRMACEHIRKAYDSAEATPPIRRIVG